MKEEKEKKRTVWIRQGEEGLTLRLKGKTGAIKVNMEEDRKSKPLPS